MRSDNKIDPNLPAMVITYGNATRKIRAIDREVMMLGSSPGCDVQLKSPDVFPVHILLLRVANGWRMRDATGRGMTRLNGVCTSDSPLRNGDIIQINTFSFQLHLPRVSTQRDTVMDYDPSVSLGEAAAAEPVPAAQFDKIQRSRQRLGRLALRLRQRAQTLQATLAQAQDNTSQEESLQKGHQREIDALLCDLKERRQCLDQKETALKALEEDLLAKQATMEKNLEESEEQRRLRIRVRELETYTRHLRQVPPPPSNPEVHVKLAWENEELRALVQELEQQVHLTAEVYQNEVRDLRLQMAERESLNKEGKDLRQRLVAVEQLAEARAVEIRQLQRQLDQSHGLVEDHTEYEQALHQFRLELERDRANLNDELALLHMKHQEVDIKIRETDAELSRQRDQLQEEERQLALEREQLLALRKELEFQCENGTTLAGQCLTAHDLTLSDRMAHVQKLKESVAQRRHALMQRSYE